MESPKIIKKNDFPLVKIVNSENVEGDKNFTIYYLELTYNGKKWTVVHRFSSLNEMKSKIKKLYPEIHAVLPKFPEKKLIGSMSIEVIAQRIERLESYVQGVVKFPRLAEIEEVQTKLCLSNYFNAKNDEKLSASKGDKKQIHPLIKTSVIPPVIVSIVEYVKKEGLKTEYIFYKAQSLKQLDTLRIETLGGKVPNLEEAKVDPTTASMVLKVYLEEKDPILTPYTVFLTLEDQKTEKGKIEMAKQLLKNLSEQNYHTIFYLTEFLQQILEYSDDNKLDSKKLLQIFAPIVMRPSKTDGEEVGALDSQKTKNILKFLMEYFDAIFTK